MSIDVIGDSLYQVADAVEDSPADSLVGEFAQPAFDQIEPGTGRRSEMHVEAWMAFEPASNFDVFVRAVVVDHQVQVQIGRGLGVDELEELDPFLVAVPWRL